jgi:ribonuclease HIII
VAAKSVAVARDATDVLDSVDAYARANGGTAERVPIQHGTRVRMRFPPGATGLNVFPSKGGGCKVVFDDPLSEHANALAESLGAVAATARSANKTSRAVSPVIEDATAWVGSDESGKGDYFGPLVVAAVAVRSDNWRVLEALGVQDSKSVSDSRVQQLADELRGAFPNEVVTIMPRRYNELWTSMGNVNRVLAWAHARAIENVLTAEPSAEAAVADQFGDESLIQRALFERGRAVRLVQMPRAERDPAVAAASLLARAEFLRRLAQLSRDAGVPLPKGAAPAVEAAGRSLVAARGEAALGDVAKLHFKTTERVLAQR